jgi:hypothetical protein
MKPDRLVEIWWSHGNERGYGSGYLISDRLILTCDHVIRPLGQSSDPGQIEYRFAQYALPGSWFSRKSAPKVMYARHSWSDRGLDAAVLTATAPLALMSPDPILAAAAVPSDKLAYDADAAGFPKASETDKITELCHVRGSISTLEGLREQKLWITLDSGNRPVKKELWVGLSGGPIFADGRLVGIAASYNDEFDGWKLAGVPMEVLARQPGFLALVPSAGAAPGPGHGGGPGAPNLLDLKGILIPVCALDRESHVNKFRANVRAAAKDPVIKPTALFWGGHEHHRHDLLIQRFEKFEISEALKDIPGLRPCANIDRFEDACWPDVVDDIEGLWMILTEQIRNLLGSGSVDPEEIRAVLNDGIKPRSFFCAIDSETFDDLQEQLLRRFINFWDEIAFSEKVFGKAGKKNTQLPVTLLFYFHGQNEAKAVKDATDAHNWASQSTKNLRVDNLPPFNLVLNKHIATWLEGPVRRNSPALTGSLDKLKDYFETWISERQLPLGDVYKEIEALAKHKRQLT